MQVDRRNMLYFGIKLLHIFCLSAKPLGIVINKSILSLNILNGEKRIMFAIRLNLFVYEATKLKKC